MMRNRNARIGFTSLVLVVGGFTATTMPSAAQSPDKDAAADTSPPKYRKIKHCDDTAIIGYFAKTKTVTSKGRTARLYTEKEPDDRAYSYAYDIAQGDKVYVQRSKNTFAMSKPDTNGWHPPRSWVYEMGAVRSCENTAGWYEANVNDHMFTDAVTVQRDFVRAYAVRTCINPTNGDTKCSKWWVDHKD